MSLAGGWFVWRMLKWVGLCAWAAGTVGLLAAPDPDDRVRWLYRLAIPGLATTWAAGWMLMRSTALEPSAPWIGAAVATSLLAMHGLIARAHGGGAVHGVWVGAGSLATLAAMTLRPEDAAGLGTVGALGLVGGLAGLGRAAGPSTPPSEAAVARGFQGVAWVEGLTLLALFGVVMPMKYGLGIDPDGGTGLVGWIHGTYFLLYLRVLASTASRLGWSWGLTAAGFVAAIVPFGTFLFERRALRAS